MVNSRLKGRRSEYKCKKILESEGWLVELVKPSVKFNKQVDLFGLFDIICIKNINNKTILRCIQIKTNNRINKQKRFEMIEFKEKFSDLIIEEWVFRDYKKEPNKYLY